MSAEQNKTTAEDWLNFSEQDSSWLKALELDESLQQSNEADLDWLLSLDALQEKDTKPTVSTTGTTASLGVPPANTSSPSLEKLDNLFANPVSDLTGDQSILPWDSLDEFAKSPTYEAISQFLSLENYAPEELEAWEREALQATQDPDYGDWTEVPSSQSEMALQEAQQSSDIEGETRAFADIEDGETRAFGSSVPPTYEVQEMPQAHSFNEDIGDHFSEVVETEDRGHSQVDQIFEEIISEAQPIPKAGEFSFLEDDFQRSEFDISHQQDSFALPSPPTTASYLDNFELKPEDINLDINPEEFSSFSDTPPLHETFSSPSVPPLPPLPPRANEDSSPSEGDRWANPAKQMSTGLNPDRRPFEPAPPSLITNVAPSKAKSEIDIFDMDENTDWSGLLETDTAVEQREVPFVPPLPELSPKPKAVKPASPAEAKEVPNPPPAVLHQQVHQLQELLSNSNLSAVNTSPVVREVSPPSPEINSAQKVQPPKIPLLPALPWLAIAKFGGIAVGAITVLWVGGAVLNRPLLELGLRTGLWKDASGRDLSGIVLNNANLENANFSHSNLKGARLQNANLKGANLSQAQLDGVSLAGANLRGARLHRASVEFSDLTKADLSLVDLSEADLTRANLTGAKLNGANLQGTKIGKPRTAKATKLDREALLLWQALNEPAVGRNMSRANFLGFRFNNADLRRANFSDSNLSFATFENAKLNGANFAGAKLDSTNFKGADLSGAFLGDALWDRDKPPQSDGKTICPNGKLGPCRW